MRGHEADPGGIVSVSTSPLRLARKVAVAVIGASVLAFGIALIVLPGPAFIVIPLGLAILATEFLWARRLLRRVREGATAVFHGSDDGMHDSDDGMNRSGPGKIRGPEC